MSICCTYADRRSDHDPHFGISDGERLISFIVVDNYGDLPSYYSAEGDDVKVSRMCSQI